MSDRIGHGWVWREIGWVQGGNGVGVSLGGGWE